MLVYSTLFNNIFPIQQHEICPLLMIDSLTLSVESVILISKYHHGPIDCWYYPAISPFWVAKKKNDRLAEFGSATNIHSHPTPNPPYVVYFCISINKNRQKSQPFHPGGGQELLCHRLARRSPLSRAAFGPSGSRALR